MTYVKNVTKVLPGPLPSNIAPVKAFAKYMKQGELFETILVVFIKVSFINYE